MTLDESGTPLTITEAIEYGRQQVRGEMEALAATEAKTGDGRALRIVTRYVAALRAVWGGP